jgi:hypothetical protein
MVGAKSAAMGAREEDMADELEAMKARLREKTRTYELERAMKNGASKVQEEIQSELRHKLLGQGLPPPSMRLSDPANVARRNLAYAENTDSEMHRASPGVARLSELEFKAIANGNKLK